MPIITHELIEAGANSNAYNKKQLAILGVKWPPKKGWKKKLIGKFISDSSLQDFYLLRKTPVNELDDLFDHALSKDNQ